MLILITGKPGSFKTAKCASLAIDYLKAGRRVFTNIDEFNYEGVENYLIMMIGLIRRLAPL